MIGVLIVGHGGFPTGLLDAATMIMGQQEQVDAIGLQPEQGPEEFLEALRAKAEKVNSGKGVLVLADLFGGSPANTSAYLMSDEELGFPVDVVTGVSLPMVLEALVVRSNMELADVVDVCLEVAGESVRKLSDILG